jgi:hypothetical protein
MKIRSFMMATLALASLSVAACDHPPEIDRILLDRSILRSDESAVLSISVHDKSGLDDLVGAQLYSQDLTYWYGSLAEVSDGVFETTITWGRLQQASPITFDFPIQRTLTVIVEDNEGGSDSLPVTLELRCRAKEHACNGACYPVELDCKDV